MMSTLTWTLLAVSACVTPAIDASFEPMLQTWAGTDIKGLIAKWGPPAQIETLTSGQQKYSFTSNTQHDTPLLPSAGVASQQMATVVTGAGGNPTVGMAETSMFGDDTRRSTRNAESCTVGFIVNDSQQIIHMEYHGNDCHVSSQMPARQ